MRNRNALGALFATAALAAVALAAAPASAATPLVTVTSFGDPDLLPAGQTLIADFNDANNPTAVLLAGYSLALAGSTVGVSEGGSGYSGTLPNDPTHYLTIPGNTSATLFSLNGLKSFSLYMGSPDTYNSIQFLGANYDQTLSGGQITLGNTSQSWGYGARVNFDFGGAAVNQVVLRSDNNSFEVDNFAGQAAVPEPATWAMLIMGFGAMGAVIRRRRTTYSFA